MKKRRQNAPRHDKYQGLAQYPDGSWGVDCRLGNRRVRKKVGSETEARHELQRIKVCFRAGVDPFSPPAPEPGSPSSAATMAAVLESYAAHVQGETDQVYAARWIATLGHLRPPEVTVQLLRPLLRALLEERKPATVHRAVDVLRAAWNDGQKPGVGLIPKDLENPCDDRKALGLPRVDNLRQTELTEDQEEALIRELGEFWWPYARFALLTGIRFGNLAGMRDRLYHKGRSSWSFAPGR